MKKIIVFSLLFLSLSGLYAMEAGGMSERFIYDQLPFVAHCEVMQYILPDTFPIAPEDAVQDVCEYEHGGRVMSVCFSPNSGLLASCGDDGKVKIKSLIPLLLAAHKQKDPTLSQFLLLKRLQEKLFKEKEPLLIGQSDRGTLEGLPDLKKLLKVEHNKNTKNAKAALWRLQLRRPGDFMSHDVDKSDEDEPKSNESEPEHTAGRRNICSVM